MERQCLAWMACIGGSLGSYLRANIGLVFAWLLITLLSATWRGMSLALSIAAVTILSEYPLSSINSLSFRNCLSLSAGFEQILTILKHNEKGMFLVQAGGWQELGSKYMFLSVSFLYKSVSILPSLILHKTSKKGMEDCGVQLQMSSSFSPGGEV